MIARMHRALIKLENHYFQPFVSSKRLSLFVIIVMMSMLSGCAKLGLLNPKGLIAYQERKLLFDTLALMLIVVIPVIIMSIVFVYHYQVSHRIRDYKPNWSHSYFLETIWWTIPCIIVIILAAITWHESHKLDPYSPIPGHAPPKLTIQAIALPWKWLFIYPEQNIAAINEMAVPVGAQVEFMITADNVPMSAFFIPQLGSQIYAMAGMRTRLHLIASHEAEIIGVNSQYNGAGFSDMHFIVHAVQPDQMQNWMNQVKSSGQALTPDVYKKLLEPSIASKPEYFSSVPTNFFNDIMMTYMKTYGNVHPRQAIPKPHEDY